MIRPTARLNFDISAEDYTENLVLDLKRCFLNVAPLTIRRREETDDPAEKDGVLGLVVVLNYPYWMEDDDRAETNWDNVLVPWLEKKLYKLNATVQGYNKTNHVSVSYGRFEIIVGGHTLSILLPPSMEIPDIAIEAVKQLRNFVKRGLLPDDAFGTVDVPWKDPEYFARLKEIKEASCAKNDSDSVCDCGEGTNCPEKESGLPIESVEQCGDSPAADESPISEEDGEALRELPIDYAIWGVCMNDGAVRKFDSVNGEWAD